MKYIMNKNILISTKNNIYALYHIYNMNLIFLNKDAYYIFKYFREFRDLKSVRKKFGLEDNKLLTVLIKNDFLVGEKFSYEKEIYKYKSENLLPKISVLYLITTLNCNFNCSYCFLKDGGEKILMNKDTAKRGIDLFFYNFQKEYNNKKDIKGRIIFYGGEPLLNFEIIKFSVNYIINNYYNYINENKIEFIINTNGSIINKQIINFLKKFNFLVSVSLDGKKNINDKARILKKDGKGTYNIVSQTIKLFNKYGINYGISLTIGKHNIKTLIQEVKFIAKEYGTKSISVNLLLDYGYKNNPMHININKYIPKILGAFNYLNNKNIYEDRVGRRISSFISRKNHIYDCAGCSGQIVVSPDGYMGPCHAYLPEKKYFIKLKNKINLKRHPIWVEWAKRTPFNMPSCYRCKYISICGGGCPHNADMMTGSIWGKDIRICSFIKKTLEYFIWESYDNYK